MRCRRTVARKLEDSGDIVAPRDEAGDGRRRIATQEKCPVATERRLLERGQLPENSHGRTAARGRPHQDGHLNTENVQQAGDPYI